MEPLIRRRRYRLVLLAVACAALAVGALWLSRPRVSISQATCDKIKPGMTRAEVEALFGGPPGDYSPNFALPVIPNIPPGEYYYVPDYRRDTWFNRKGMIEVVFDENDKVSTAFFSDRVIVLNQGFLGELRFRLGW